MTKAQRDFHTRTRQYLDDVLPTTGIAIVARDDAVPPRPANTPSSASSTWSPACIHASSSTCPLTLPLSYIHLG